MYFKDKGLAIKSFKLMRMDDINSKRKSSQENLKMSFFLSQKKSRI